MISARFSARGFLLLTLALSAAAQSVREDDPMRIPWRSFIDPGSFGRSVAMELTGDKRRDLVVLDGGTPVVIEDPDRHDSWVPLSIVAEDLAPLQDATPGARGGILTVGSDGLALHVMDYASRTFQIDLIAADDWIGGRIVRVGQLDGTGKLDAIGVAADRLQVMELIAQEDSWTPGREFNVALPILDLELVEWDGDGELEVVLRHASHLAIHELDGTPVATFTGGTSEGSIAVVSVGSDLPQFVAWTSGDTWLSIVGEGGVVEVRDLGSVGVIGLAAGDFDQDGTDDLFASLSSMRRVRMWRGVATSEGPTFPAAEDFVLEDLAGSIPLSSAPPVLADLDGDYDLDLFLPQEDDQVAYLFRGDAFDEERWLVKLVPTYSPGLKDQELTLRIASPHTVPGTATHLRVRVWGQVDYSLTLGTEWVAVVTEPLGDWPMDVSIPVPPRSGGEYGQEVHNLELDLVCLSPGGSVRKAWSAYCGSYANDVSVAEMIAADVNQSVTPVYLSPDGGGQGGGDEAGGFVPRDRITPFPVGSLPED